MKSNTNIRKEAHRRIARQSGRPAPRTPEPRAAAPARSLRSLAIGVIGALLVGGGTWAFFELVVWNTVPAELVGKWVVVEGPQEGATFDFYRGGTMVGHINAGGKEAIVNARIRVEDKNIYSTTTNPQTGAADTKVLAIRSVSADALVLESEQGERLQMERAQ